MFPQHTLRGVYSPFKMPHESVAHAGARAAARDDDTDAAAYSVGAALVFQARVPRFPVTHIRGDGHTNPSAQALDAFVVHLMGMFSGVDAVQTARSLPAGMVIPRYAQ